MRHPGFVLRIGARVNRLVRERPPVARALLLGLFSTLLPCGWLYAFAVLAAGTGGPWTGMLVMAAFWAGTVPVGSETNAVLHLAMDRPHPH